MQYKHNMMNLPTLTQLVLVILVKKVRPSMAMLIAIGGMFSSAACQQDELRSSNDLKATEVVHVSSISSADVPSDGAADKEALLAGLDEALSDDLVESTPPPAGVLKSVAPVQLTQTQQYKYTYKLPAKVEKLDVVWMIDNSGSMVDNIRAVQSHMRSFVNWLQTVGQQQGIDVFAFLISCDSPSSSSESYADVRHCMNFDQLQHQRLFRISRAWQEKDSLNMVAILVRMATTVGDPLAQRLQPDSKKIFVVVTDEAAHLNQDSIFSSEMSRAFGQDNITFFSYSSPRPTSINLVLADGATDDDGAPDDVKNNYRQKFKDRARTWLPQAEAYFAGRASQLVGRTFFYHKMCGGEMTYSHVYEYLAKQYRGKLYSICSQNWSQHFADLKGDITSQIERVVDLDELAHKTNLKYISVNLGQRVLASSEYAITGSNPPKLTLRTSRNAAEVVITVSHDRI